jgi:hypothetical protein
MRLALTALLVFSGCISDCARYVSCFLVWTSRASISMRSRRESRRSPIASDDAITSPRATAIRYTMRSGSLHHQRHRPRRPEGPATMERSVSRGDARGRGCSRNASTSSTLVGCDRDRQDVRSSSAAQRSEPEGSVFATVEVSLRALPIRHRNRETVSSRRLQRAYRTVGVHDPEVERSGFPTEGHAVTEAALSVDPRDGQVRDPVPPPR